MNDRAAESQSIRALLLCGAGFSATWLLSSILKAAEASGVKLKVISDTIDGFAYRDLEKDPFDIILIAPQVRIARRNIVKKAEPFGIKVVLMDTMAFGMADGEKLFRQILEALPDKRKGSRRLPRQNESPQV